jgi:coenzyme Q-binding protein COQ10
MHNRWTFRPLTENTCDVEFFIDYEFRSRAFALLAGAVFDQVFRRMAGAFEARAAKIYGRPVA